MVEDERLSESCSHVGRAREHQRHLDVVALAVEDDRKEIGKGIGRSGGGQEEEGVTPDLPVLQVRRCRREGDLIGDSVSSIAIDPFNDECLLLFRQELGLIRDIDKDEEGDQA